MCLACEEEAFYRAYLEFMEKKAKAEAAAQQDAGMPAGDKAAQPAPEAKQPQ
jgi:hypothetical protein